MKIAVLLTSLIFNFNAFAEEAFGGPGLTPNWASAQKISVGTSYSKEQKDKNSLVWYSAAGGILTETYYPSIDTPQIKDAQLLLLMERLSSLKKKILITRLKF